MVVGVAFFRFCIHQSFSLKQKRQVLRSIFGRVRSKFDISIAEIGDNDKWQGASVAVAVVSNDSGHAHSMLEAVHKFIEELHLVEITSFSTEIIHFGDASS
jgi:uncharacterized protein YlxP (DUF503 family)